MENNMNNQNLDNAVNVTNSLTMKDRIKGWIRRNITVKKVVGAAAFGASCYGIGYAVGYHKKQPVATETPDQEPVVITETPLKEGDELLGINDEQLSEMGLKYQPEEQPETEKEVEA